MRLEALAGALLGVLAIGAPRAAADVMTAIVDPYVRIQTALAGDSMAGVDSSAAEIVKAAQSIGSEAEAIARAASRLQQTKELADARKAFGELSDALLGYVKTAGIRLDETVRLAYCPMVRKSWLQKDKTIANPYYGRQMYDCGEFRSLPAPKS